MREMPYIFRWDRFGRKGQLCAVTARSRRGKGSHNFNSIRVVFEDGFTMITSGNAIMRRNDIVAVAPYVAEETSTDR